jgi:transcriptional regulator with XRE-family HTH domain
MADVTEARRAFPGERFNAARFRVLRTDRGWSQSEVSRRTYRPGAKPEQISQALLSAYERGQYTPRPEYLLRIAQAFDVPPGDLLVAA